MKHGLLPLSEKIKAINKLQVNKKLIDAVCLLSLLQSSNFHANKACPERRLQLCVECPTAHCKKLCDVIVNLFWFKVVVTPSVI